MTRDRLKVRAAILAAAMWQARAVVVRQQLAVARAQMPGAW